MTEAVICTPLRTAIGNEGGALRDIPAVLLGAHIIREVVQRSGINPEEIEDVIMGDTNTIGQRPARNALLLAGLPVSVPGLLVRRACGSGLTAINLAAKGILTGEGEVYVAGGMESLTRIPWSLERLPAPYSRTPPKWVGEEREGLGDPSLGMDLPPAIAIGENSAEKFGISREDMDAFALLSHQRAVRAIQEGRFRDQIVPVPVPQRRGEPIPFDTDEHPRPDTSLERLSRLPPVFKKGGTITAGNACGITDAASAMLVLSREKAHALGLEIMGTLKAHALVGAHPTITGIAPAYATKKVLARAGLRLEDIDLIELNEAFGSQALAVIRELSLDLEKTNVNGGAIALGHPTGATGAILMVKLLHEMKRRQSRYGLVTMCIGGGMGIATIVERDSR